MANSLIAGVLVAAAIVMLSILLMGTKDQPVTVGPWTIASTYKADKFDSCTMSQSVAEIGISFVLTKYRQLRLVLDSPKWRLDRGKAYTVRLVADSQSVEAKALAESKSVTIALSDGSLSEKIRMANFLEIKGEGKTIQVPLVGGAAALDRLETCFHDSRVEENPFVALPDRKF